MVTNWHSHAVILIVGQHIEVENSVHINVYKIKVILHCENIYINTNLRCEKKLQGNVHPHYEVW
jgi:hypothetical protein